MKTLKVLVDLHTTYKRLSCHRRLVDIIANRALSLKKLSFLT